MINKAQCCVVQWRIQGVPGPPNENNYLFFPYTSEVFVSEIGVKLGFTPQTKSSLEK